MVGVLAYLVAPDVKRYYGTSAQAFAAIERRRKSLEKKYGIHFHLSRAEPIFEKDGKRVLAGGRQRRSRRHDL